MINILLVDDNMGDIRLTQEAFRDANAENHLWVCQDGFSALSFLRKADEFFDVPTPQIILLDINMPGKSGLAVLKEIKGDAQLKSIPVIMLTTSVAENDINQSYALNANCYLAKPVDFEQFTKVVQSIEDFWLTLVRLPTV